MANRIVGNCYILDTASANVALPWNAGTRIKAINFFALDSTGALRLTGSDTSDAVVRIVHPANNNASQTFNFVMNGWLVSEMKVPTLTAGTAWIYFG